MQSEELADPPVMIIQSCVMAKTDIREAEIARDWRSSALLVLIQSIRMSLIPQPWSALRGKPTTKHRLAVWRRSGRLPLSIRRRLLREPLRSSGLEARDGLWQIDALICLLWFADQTEWKSAHSTEIRPLGICIGPYGACQSSALSGPIKQELCLLEESPGASWCSGEVLSDTASGV